MSRNEALAGRSNGEQGGARSLSFERVLWSAATVAFIFCALLWLKVPAADFDEALYAEMAKVMQRTGEYLQPIWDERAVYDKPPLFIWTLLPFAAHYHPALEWPGLLRIGNLLCSFAVAVGAAGLVRSSFRASSIPDGQGAAPPSAATAYGTPFLLYFCALLPFLGMGLLLIDLLLCLFLFPVFALLDSGFRRQTSGENAKTPQVFLTLGQSIVAGLCIATAAATKGLIAWIIPGLAAVAMSLWTRQGLTFGQVAVLALRRFWILFLVAVLGTVSFYGAIWYAGHEDFVRSFFVEHHFGRGSSAMEGHSGSPLYHPIVIWAGGGWMSAALLAGLRRRWYSALPWHRRGDFGLWWLIVTLIFFSLIATKLPNYTWPVWMALPVVVGRLFTEGQPEAPEKHPSMVQQILHRLADLATRLLAVLYVLIGCGVALFPFALSLLTSENNAFYARLQQLVDRRVLAIVSGNSFSFFESLSCWIVALCFFVLGVLILRVGRARTSAMVFRQAPLVVLVQAVLMIFVVTGILPLGKRAYLDPVLRAAERASADFSTTNVVTFGVKSPSFSSAYRGSGKVTQVSWDSDFDEGVTGETLLVLPTWTDRGCRERLAEQVETVRFLVLCFRVSKPSP